MREREGERVVGRAAILERNRTSEYQQEESSLFRAREGMITISNYGIEFPKHFHDASRASPGATTNPLPPGLPGTIDQLEPFQERLMTAQQLLSNCS